MNIRFFHEPDSGEPHIWRHGIRQREVADVLASSLEDRPGRDESRVALGRTEAGRYIRVVYVPDPVDGVLFVVTALDLKANEKRALLRRLRNKR